MKRRDFLKLIGVTAIAPSTLAAMPRKELAFKNVPLKYNKTLPEGGRTINRPIRFAMGDISKDGYGWVQIRQQWTYSDVK